MDIPAIGIKVLGEFMLMSTSYTEVKNSDQVVYACRKD